MTLMGYVILYLYSCVSHYRLPIIVVSIYILAWASALLVLTSWAMPEPLNVGRVTGRFPRFFLYIRKSIINNRLE